MKRHGRWSFGERFLKVVLPPSDRKHVLDELSELAEIQAAKVGEEGAERRRRRGLVLRVQSSSHVLVEAAPLGFS